MKPKKNKNGFYVINKNFKCCPECGGTRFVYTCYVEWKDAYELKNGKFILIEGQYGVGYDYIHPKTEIMTCENCGSKFINKIERCSRNGNVHLRSKEIELLYLQAKELGWFDEKTL